MSTVVTTSIIHPRAQDVEVTDERPRTITVQLAAGIEVELWPGADDHDEQVQWLDAVAAQLRTARELMNPPAAGDHDRA